MSAHAADVARVVAVFDEANQRTAGGVTVPIKVREADHIDLGASCLGSD